MSVDGGQLPKEKLSFSVEASYRNRNLSHFRWETPFNKFRSSSPSRVLFIFCVIVQIRQ